MEEIENIENAVYLKGGKRAVLLMHAYTGTPNDVRSLGRKLNTAGYTVLMPLFDGHGTNNPEDILDKGPIYWQKSLENYLSVLKKAGHEEVAVFGLSLGGIFAMRSLEQFPELVIGGGIFCSPVSPKFQTNIIPSFKFYAKSKMQRAKVIEKEVESRLDQLTEPLNQQLVEISAYSKQTFNDLPLIKQPTLLVQAGKDKMINPDDVYDVADELIHSQPEIKWYPESGHVVTVGPEKKEFEEDVLLFINKLRWQTSLDQ